MAITRAQQVRQMLREGTDPRIVPEEFALAPILAETEDTDDAGLDMSPFLYDDFQQRARPGFNVPFAKELGLAGLTAAKKLPPVQFIGKILSGLGSFRPSRSSKLGLFGRSETLADFFQAMRDQKAREDAAARGLEKQRSQAMQAMRSDQAMRGGEGGNQGGSTQEQAGPGFGDVGEAGSFAEGGDVRQGYFLGKVVKKAKRAVKKIVKSPVGKLGLGALILGAGGGFKPDGFLRNKALPFLLENKGLALAAGLISAPFFMGQEDEGQQVASMGSVGGQIDPRAYTDPYSVLFPAFKSEGGPLDEKMNELLKAFETYKKMGGTLSYEDFSKIFATENFAEGGDVEPVAKKTMPLLDMGGQEMDLRAEGGFVPIGRMEKADDVPARLSKNEFVFTADAVRNAGDGDVDKGAEVMYNMMKNLEAGGDVSEESQGLEGARKMFQTSQRLEEVL
jgi:hypothetical protein